MAQMKYVVFRCIAPTCRQSIGCFVPNTAIAERLGLSAEAKRAAAGLDLAALAAMPDDAPLCDLHGHRQCRFCGRVYDAALIAAR